MKKTGLPPIAWILAGLLGIAAIFISLGQQDDKTNPEVSSYSPSGLSAFAQLLRLNGIPVTVDQQPRPELQPNDVAVAFSMQQSKSGILPDDERQDSRFDDEFWKFISKGGSGILLTISSNFLEASRTAQDTPTSPVKDLATGKTYDLSVSLSSGDPFAQPDSQESTVGIGLWTMGDEPFMKAFRVGKGTVLAVRDGIGATNRFIDKGDNAQAFTGLVKMLAKGGKRVVFAEASFGNVHEKSLLETVGPWANAAWQQLLFLGLVVLFTLGKRFGLPEEYRSVQRGSRDMLEAIGDTFRRARATQIALSTAWDRADADIRLALKLPRDATRAERDRLIPIELQNALARLEAAKEMSRVPPDQALDLIRRAQTELDRFLAPYRAKMLSLAKLKTS